MDRFESMSVLVAATEAGSLSAASRRLGMPLASVSRKVSELEQHLKTRLLTRSSRQLTLTDAGRSYLAACKRILGELGEAERTAAGEFSAPKGDLVVTAPIVFGRLHVLPVIAEFLQSYPDIDVRLNLTDRIASLLEDRVDVAVRVGELPDSSLIVRNIGAIQRVVCGSPSYFDKRKTPKRPDDLRTHDCITFEGLSSPEVWTFAGGKGGTTVRVHSRLIVNTAEAAIDAAVAGLGVTRLLSYQVAAATRAGTLRRVLRSHEPSPTPVGVVYLGQTLLPLKLRVFLDFATPRLKSGLTQAAI
jgi:DNA-binding transcriptional LysR family regulator